MRFLIHLLLSYNWLKVCIKKNIGGNLIKRKERDVYMRKVNNSKRTLDENPQLTDLVNHAQTYTDIRNTIENENESVSKKIHYKQKPKALTYDEMQPYNTKFK